MGRHSSIVGSPGARRPAIGRLIVRLGILALVVPTAGIASPPPHASNAVVGAGEHGALAQANFVSTDASGCIVTFGGVMGSYVSRQAPPPTHEQFSQLSFLSLGVFNQCTGTLLLEAHGGGPNIPDDQLRIDPSLHRASIDTTVDVCDSVSGACAPAHFDVTWTGIGDVQRFEQRSVVENPKSIFWARSASRDATATGSITWFGIDFATGAATRASISMSHQQLVVPGFEE